jgi:hypothetical protein
MPPKKAPKVQFTVESIDVDNDDIPDGDMVCKYVDGVLVSRKFVPHDTMAEIAVRAGRQSSSRNARMSAAKNAAKAPQNAAKAPQNAAKAPNAGAQKLYQNVPDVAQTDKRVIVQEDTGFGQYIKAGAGMEAGRLATDAVVDGLMGLFD